MKMIPPNISNLRSIKIQQEVVQESCFNKKKRSGVYLRVKGLGHHSVLARWNAANAQKVLVLRNDLWILSKKSQGNSYVDCQF